MNNQTTWLVIAGIIAITTITGLDVLFITADVTAQQPVILVEDSDPCRLITCGPGKIRAEAVGTNPLTENTICRCPNRAEYYDPLYQVSARRKY
ncbi:MAG: hypothetical protein HY363_02050 [Candidatus Aenigmarchaeota archaeon]|nr:hypothetical protein [Candidatus Aenigmarchaeota archaeon]